MACLWCVKEKKVQKAYYLGGWRRRKRKKSVQIELHAQNKIRTTNNNKTLNFKYYQDLVPFFNLFAKMQSFFLQASVFRFTCAFCKNKRSNLKCALTYDKGSEEYQTQRWQDGNTKETTDNPSWSFFFWPLHNYFIMKHEELSKLRNYLNFLFSIISRKNMTSHDKYKACRCASVHLQACDYYIFFEEKRTRQW